jgi:hypothetical protein
MNYAIVAIGAVIILATGKIPSKDKMQERRSLPKTFANRVWLVYWFLRGHKTYQTPIIHIVDLEPTTIGQQVEPAVSETPMVGKH